MKRILITGAAGRLGTALREQLAGAYPILRLSDVQPLGEARPGEELDTTDLSDLDAVVQMMQGVDGVVHLGGVAAERDWKAIQSANIEGCFNVFEAARLAGVKRVVYASSNHAVGFYPRTQRLDHTTLPLPDSRYGISKAVGESIGAMYAFKHHIGVMCLRIGHFNTQPRENRHLSIWVSPRDLSQLVRIGLDHPGIQYEIVYGVSDNKRSWWDNRRAEELGYRPQDRSEDFAAGMAAPKTEDLETVVERYQGGVYCAAR